MLPVRWLLFEECDGEGVAVAERGEGEQKQQRAEAAANADAARTTHGRCALDFLEGGGGEATEKAARRVFRAAFQEAVGAQQRVNVLTWQVLKYWEVYYWGSAVG